MQKNKEPQRLFQVFHNKTYMKIFAFNYQNNRSNDDNQFELIIFDLNVDDYYEISF